MASVGCAGYVQECKKLCTVNGTLSKEFEVGVYQGWLLSPLLFIMVLDVLLRKLRSVSMGIIICWWSHDDWRDHGRQDREI